MANWSGSPLLQALGWATLNSLWQIALLWILFSAASSLFRLSPLRKYYTATAALLLGFGGFVASFLSYWLSGSNLNSVLVSPFSSPSLISTVVNAAAVTYLALFAVPLFRFFNSWRPLRKLRKGSLQKADLEYRLFVKRTAVWLGIKKPVRLYLSQWVTSSVTVGYLKPVILLPVAALSHLSLAQTEALLLHELSHIRRSDYLINWILTIIHTVLYFNPFVRLFLRVIEAEREACCDQLVLQFGYDKLSYASALLALEKRAAQTPTLSLAATGRKFLLRRIERIVGVEKRSNGFGGAAGLLAAFFCILLLHSLLFLKKPDATNEEGGISYFTRSLLFTEDGKTASPTQPTNKKSVNFLVKASPASGTSQPDATETVDFDAMVDEPDDATPFIVPVSYEDKVALSPTEDKQVETAVDVTKKVLHNLQWKEVEKSIADAMTDCEKAAAKREYATEVESVNWPAFTENLKGNYEKINWEKVNAELRAAMVTMQLDSVQTNYTAVLSQIKTLENGIKAKVGCATTTPFPDASLNEINRQKEVLKTKLEKLRQIRTKKIVRL